MKRSIISALQSVCKCIDDELTGNENAIKFKDSAYLYDEVFFVKMYVESNCFLDT